MSWIGLAHVSLVTALAACCAITLPVRLAHAEPVSLGFEAPSGCPDEGAFRAAVAERGGRFDGPEAEARVRGLAVGVFAANDGFSGRLRVETPSGASDVREVRDPACVEVVRGLAIVAAIALGSEPVPSDGKDSQEPVTEAAPTHTQPKAAVPAPPVVPEAPKPRLIGSSYHQLPPQKKVEAGTIRFDTARSYTLMGGLEYGLLPKVALPRFDFMASLANFVTTPDGESRLVGSVIQLHWSWAGPVTRRFRDHESRVMALRVSADLCTAPSYDTNGLVLLVCAELGGGLAAVRTRALPGRPRYEQQKEIGFGFGSLAADARYNLGELLHLGVRAGLTAQLGEVTAEKANGDQLFASSGLGGYGVAGLGLHF